MPKRKNNIVLVGLMGAGKSTVGRELAAHLGFAFIDTDDELERRMGVTIPVIFDVEGEQGFRKRETRVIQDMPSLENTVISTGGGAILSKQNRHFLRLAGKVVYLSASIDLLYERTKNNKKRPLLKKETIKQDLTALLDVRESLYQEVSDIVVQSGSCSPKEMAKLIVKKLS